MTAESVSQRMSGVTSQLSFISKYVFISIFRYSFGPVLFRIFEFNLHNIALYSLLRFTDIKTGQSHSTNVTVLYYVKMCV